MKKLFDSAEPKDYSELVWRVFGTYLGSDDCSKLTTHQRVEVVDLYNALERYFMKKWREQDEQLKKIS